MSERSDEFLARRTALGIKGTGMAFVLRRLGQGPASKEDLVRIQNNIGTTSHPLIVICQRLQLAGLAAGAETIAITADGLAVLRELNRLAKEGERAKSGS